ncbi:MAG: DUF429 domain-containing protein [Natronomonas sp.]
MSGRYLGVVARSGLFLAVVYDSDGYDHTAIFEGIGELWTEYEETATQIAIDVPIGLPTDETPRPNERAARAILGERSETVFAAPVREASRKQRHQAATRVQRRKTGRSLSAAAFDRSNEIAAVDSFLEAIEEARPVFCEAHPEVCYTAFGGEPPEYEPSVAAGYAERMRVLAEFDRDAPPTVQSVAESTGGYELSVAAVVDAVALGLTVRPGSGSLRSLPADPPTDDTGLSMAYVYRSESALQG